MNDTQEPLSDQTGQREFSPEELPPVQPPSAGFIVQLFVVPAIIVAAIIGVWALFGKMAAGQQDWRELVTELKSENELRRWRAAHGLAQLLASDQRFGAEDESLAANPEIASALSSLFKESLEKDSVSTEDLKNQTFLASALGYSDVRSEVLPVLEMAVAPEHDADVRRLSLMSIAMVAGRAKEQDRPVKRKETVEAVTRASKDGLQLLRQVAAFTLGLLPTDPAHDRLVVMLDDSNREVRANAAIGLARGNSKEGLPVFVDVLSEAQKTMGKEFVGLDESKRESARFQEFLSVKNSLKALNEIARLLTDDERADLNEKLAPIAEKYHEPVIRADAGQVIATLRKTGSEAESE